MSHRPTVYGTRHAVSAGHYLAAAAAFSILEAGGNAIDAGCAAGIALGVLQPDLVNVAGVAPIMIRLANGTGGEHRRSRLVAEERCRPTSSCASTAARSPTACCAPSFPRHRMPGSPRCGVTARCASPMSPPSAIRYAGEGFAVYPLLAVSIAAHEHEYRRWPSNTAIFLPGGRVPQSGEKFVQSDLARTLQYMADQDRAAGARPRGRAARRARRLLPRRHRARDRPLPSTGRRLSGDGRPCGVPLAASSRWCGGPGAATR